MERIYNIAEYTLDEIIQFTFIIGADKNKNVVMAEHDSLVDLGFAEPRALFAGGKDFDGYVFAAPSPTPHLIEKMISIRTKELLQGKLYLSKSAFSDYVH